MTRKMPKASAVSLMGKFRQVWEMLARAGKCDDLGGQEYRRVVRAWLDGGPAALRGATQREIRAFIVTHANQPPHDPIQRELTDWGPAGTQIGGR